MKTIVVMVSLLSAGAWTVHAQEAGAGFEMRTTLSESVFHSRLLSASPRKGDNVAGGFRAVLYPTWKLSRSWTFSGAVQVRSRPFMSEDFTTQGYGVRADVIAANLSYSRFWNNRSLVVRMGQMPSVFGSFLTRYDDMDNPMIDVPMAYGYYYRPVSTNGLAGAQVDAAIGKLDARLQFTNSSPANRRSVFDRDQYGVWAGGAGYTILQGLRVGASAYRGPYLHRGHRFFFRGEANPRDLAGTAAGLDVQWGRGPWNVWGEWQRFQMDYVAIKTSIQKIGYAEVRRVLHPRWYVAGRTGYLRASSFAGRDCHEAVVGFRPGRHHLLKVGYAVLRGPAIPGSRNNTFAVEMVTNFRAISISRD